MVACVLDDGWTIEATASEHRALPPGPARGMGYIRSWTSQPERHAGYDDFYLRHRPRGALGWATPTSIVGDNLPAERNSLRSDALCGRSTALRGDIVRAVGTERKEDVGVTLSAAEHDAGPNPQDLSPGIVKTDISGESRLLRWVTINRSVRSINALSRRELQAAGTVTPVRIRGGEHGLH